jgi:hypothetical protein
MGIAYVAMLVALYVGNRRSPPARWTAPEHT